MKFLAILTAISLPVITYSQTIKVDLIEKRVYVDTVINVTGKTQSEILSMAGTWFSKSYGDAKEVIEFKGDDRLSGKAFSQISGTARYGQRLWYDITVMAKDGKARLIMDNIIIEGTASGMTSSNDVWVFYDVEGMREKEKRKVEAGRKVIEIKIGKTVSSFAYFMLQYDNW